MLVTVNPGTEIKVKPRCADTLNGLFQKGAGIALANIEDPEPFSQDLPAQELFEVILIDPRQVAE
ncbi:hypothetical protein [Pseudomonas sp. S2_F03]